MTFKVEKRKITAPCRTLAKQPGKPYQSGKVVAKVVVDRPVVRPSRSGKSGTVSGGYVQSSYSRLV